ncbi:MAG TPA: hypothetical protein VGW38_10480, partial [Chloroflexota bacterium]|nr:hypothetical protein [Chloroflexota bacterium]
PPVRQAGAAPSPPAQKFRSGDRVRHITFGEGVVVESTISRRGDEEVRVRFDTAGLKLLLGSHAPMEIVK